MPVSKGTAANIAGRNLAAGAKEPTAREAKRAATKSTTATKKGASARQAPQEASAYAASAWGGVQQFELECPSGQKCLAHELTIERLLELGLLDMINGLSGIVDGEVLPAATGQRPPTVNMNKLMADVSQLTKVMDLVNVIVVEGVDAPVLAPAPAEGEPRVDGTVYVDSVSMTDRFFIFSEVTGNLEALATFRSEAQ